MLRKSLAAAVAGCLLVSAAPAFAHHSFAQYDGSKRVELKGTVVEYQWSNPHVWITLAVEEKGAVKEYIIECPSVGGLRRVGWTARSLKKGEKVTAVVHPTKTPSLAAALYEVHTADGAKLGQTDIQRFRYNRAIGASTAPPEAPN